MAKPPDQNGQTQPIPIGRSSATEPMAKPMAKKPVPTPPAAPATKAADATPGPITEEPPDSTMPQASYAPEYPPPVDDARDGQTVNLRPAQASHVPEGAQPVDDARDGQTVNVRAASRGGEEPEADATARAANIFLVGSQEYEYIRPLGAGGMGEVFEARLHGAGGVSVSYAVKRAYENATHGEKMRAMLIDEARTISMLDQDPAIARLVNFGIGQDGLLYLVMEYVAGFTLKEMLHMAARVGRLLSEETAIHIGTVLAETLDYAHHAKDRSGRPLKVVHRDVKPANVMLTEGGHVKLMDFGIARTTLEGRDQTSVNMSKRSNGYASPEQYVDPGSVDARSDIFSLGVTLAEVLTGEPLFLSATGTKSQRRTLITPAEDIAKFLGDRMHPTLRGIVLKCLAQKKEDRYRTAGEVAHALRSYGAKVGIISTAASRRREWEEIVRASAALPEDAPAPVDRLVAASRARGSSGPSPVPAPKTEAAPVPPAPRSGRALVIAVVVALVLGGGATAAWKLGLLDRARPPDPMPVAETKPQTPAAAPVQAAPVAPAPPSPKERAQEHADRALRLDEVGEHARAADEWRKAYQELPESSFILHLASALEQNKQVKEALDLLTGYLGNHPQDARRAEFDRRITELRKATEPKKERPRKQKADAPEQIDTHTGLYEPDTSSEAKK